MTRPHTMFVQSQRIPWGAGAYQSVRSGVACKILSRDGTSGAATVLLEYPAGWSQPRPQVLGVLEEFYVLRGRLQIGDQVYADHSYGRLPAGHVRAGARSDSGAIVLTMWDADPYLSATDALRSGDDAGPPGFCYDTRSNGLEGWGVNTHTRYLVGTGVQTLRKDENSGEITILYAALPFRFMDKRWTHEHAMEMYLLAGEYSINDVGVLRPGAYAWWDPAYLHGPYGSLTGFMMLVRSCGGPLINVIPDERVAVDFAAPYKPVLPPELAPCAGEWDSHANV
jgi:hypothetical protein